MQTFLNHLKTKIKMYINIKYIGAMIGYLLPILIVLAMIGLFTYVNIYFIQKNWLFMYYFVNILNIFLFVSIRENIINDFPQLKYYKRKTN